jgi:hypothetical protein
LARKAVDVRLILAVARSLVFLAGIVGGLYFAAVVTFFGGSAALDFIGVFGGLGLLLAAPICWVMAIRRSDRGDLWTLAYVGGWAVFLMSIIFLDLSER